MQGYEINERMRALLVDWLIQVHSRFQLLQETLYMTIAIIDRFLQASLFFWIFRMVSSDAFSLVFECLTRSSGSASFQT